jgi:hypothetical protein
LADYAGDAAASALTDADVFAWFVSSRSSIREDCLKLLLRSNSALALAAARCGVSDSSPLIRGMSVDYLGHVRNRRDRFRLLLTLRDSDWQVRSSAAVAICSFPSRVVNKALLSALSSERNRIVRRDIYRALCLAGQDILDYLSAAAQTEPDELVKTALYWGMYTLGKPEYLPMLLDLASDDDHLVRVNVINSIEVEKLWPEHRHMVALRLSEAVEHESNPGNVRDAARLLARLQ